MNFRVVTCCTHAPTQDYYCLNSYVKSLRGHEAINLAEFQFSRWGGLATKTKWLWQAMKQNLITDNIFIITDCYDVVFSRPLEELIEAYKSYNVPCVASAEKNYWPEEGLKKYFDERDYPTSFKYLNSGVIVCQRDALYTILESMDLDNYPDDHKKEDGNMFHSNDQFLYGNEFAKHPDLFELDYLCKINQTMSDVKEDEIEFIGVTSALNNSLIVGAIKNKETNQIPCSIHWNGGSKTDWSMNKILKHLNLI